MTWLQNRYTAYSTKQAEEFNTASRSVKPGLIAAGIVSSWTWSSTLLTSSTFAYSYGVCSTRITAQKRGWEPKNHRILTKICAVQICGPMWYGAMGTSQILLFSLIAIKIKSNAPGGESSSHPGPLGSTV